MEMKISPALTREETEKIILATSNGMNPATEGDIAHALKWAERIRIEGDVLALVLAGELYIHVQNGAIRVLPVRAASGRS